MGKKFVFVVGAGASREFNLPTGRELLADIAAMMNSEQTRIHDNSEGEIDRALHAFSEDLAFSEAINREVAWHKLTDSLLWIAKTCLIAPSIDNLLHAHKGDPFRVTAGKILVAHTLLKAESESLLRADRTSGRYREFLTRSVRLRDRRAQPHEFKDLYPAESWLGELFWSLAENRSFDQFMAALENYTFISFNYDRCIVHFLANAAMAYYDRNDSDADSVVQGIKVLFPYGSLGSLTAEGGSITGFGHRQHQVYQAAKEIRTFTEGLANRALGSGIHQAFSGANSVIFLGFGFLDLNLEILFQGQNYSVDRVVGTSYGLSTESREIISRKITRQLFYGHLRPDQREARFPVTNPERFELTDCRARDLMDKHRLYLRGSQ